MHIIIFYIYVVFYKKYNFDALVRSSQGDCIEDIMTASIQ